MKKHYRLYVTIEELKIVIDALRDFKDHQETGETANITEALLSYLERIDNDF